MLAALFWAAGLVFFCVNVGASELPDFTGLVENNNAAVVNISTTQKLAAGNAQQQLPEGFDIPEGSPLDEFFKHYFGEGGPGGMPGMPGGSDGEPGEAKSLGSGFIISQDGYVITNHHVVKDADEIVVKLQDRRELVAKVIGSDKRSDIALIKIDATDLPTVKMGSSENLKVGEWVLAIGSPFGFEHSVTAGIVSAKGRNLPSDNYVPFIQTDVAINPGNSGGPLFNMQGQVVGVNSQIYSRTGGFMGLSFAIPIDVAMKVADQLKSGGRVARGWLGVQIQDVTRELAESFGMKKPQGSLVSKVLPKSPAEEAGIQVGDVITEFNGQEITTSSTLPPMVGMAKIGESFKVKLIRQGHVKEVTVKVGALPDEDEPVIAGTEPGASPVNQRTGISVANLTPELRKQFDVSANGVLVQEAKPGPAYDAGIRRGDVILRVQDQLIRDTKHFEELIRSLPKGKSVAVLVQRRGGSLFLAMKLKD
ncbi:DegQ family serine endoprotease [Candidatus Methylospira mobilis]|uniref:Probable periplasmic serine endoprotease DegP-like n=2 Tax=Candidatus Methylospira mobilis TaxID=1808979 RepID=A0A5Q0BPC9_9GAMM|nr:DegQ family serine endoprotease [Candidatus Methylospira mobilis]QFY45042.1 DegQ family serine endoprotease [Candidatus Methylospira mobilis]